MNWWEVPVGAAFRDPFFWLANSIGVVVFTTLNHAGIPYWITIPLAMVAGIFIAIASDERTARRSKK